MYLSCQRNTCECVKNLRSSSSPLLAQYSRTNFIGNSFHHLAPATCKILLFRMLMPRKCFLFNVFHTNVDICTINDSDCISSANTLITKSSEMCRLECICGSVRIIIIIIIIIHEFHRDAGPLCVMYYTTAVMSMLLWPIVCVAVMICGTVPSSVHAGMPPATAAK